MTPADLRRALSAWMPAANVPMLLAQEGKMRQNLTRRHNTKAIIRSKIMAENQVDTQHTEAEEAELRAHYEMLLPEATTAYVNWFLARTPAKWQDDMKDLIQEGLTEEIPAMIRNNLGAPPSQIVDVDAVAQAVAKSVGTREADAARDKGNEMGSANPATNSRFPLVNTKPTPEGPEIVGAADEALRGPGASQGDRERKAEAERKARELNEAGNQDQPGGVARIGDDNRDANYNKANYETQQLPDAYEPNQDPNQPRYKDGTPYDGGRPLGS